MGSCLKILILEDDFINRRLIKKTILDSGYEVAESVGNVKDAVKCIEQKKIDLAILDINLGKDQANGISFGKYLKETTTIPFIYLTAYGTKEIIKSAVETVPSSYLTKPFNTPDLLAAIELAVLNIGIDSSPKDILLKVSGLYVPVCLDNIKYIESQGNYLTVFTEKESFMTRLTIKKLLGQLPHDDFYQVHRAYVVNKKFISSFNNEVVTVGNTQIPITKKYSQNFKLVYQK